MTILKKVHVCKIDPSCKNVFVEKFLLIKSEPSYKGDSVRKLFLCIFDSYQLIYSYTFSNLF